MTSSRSQPCGTPESVAGEAEPSAVETILDRFHRVSAGRNYQAALDFLRLPARLLDGHGSAPLWRPIESAPKDGTAILGAWRTGPDGSGPYAVEKLWWAGSWCEYRRKPTHWMPLPDPPALSKLEGEV